MLASSLEDLVQVFAQIPDPRKARGIRHPFSGIVALVFLGLLARITEMAVLVRWATPHWDELKEPLGFPAKSLPVRRRFPEPWHGFRWTSFAVSSPSG